MKEDLFQEGSDAASVAVHRKNFSDASSLPTPIAIKNFQGAFRTYSSKSELVCFQVTFRTCSIFVAVYCQEVAATGVGRPRASGLENTLEF